MERPKSCVKAHEVLDTKVKNTKNEDLGKIEEIILDKKKGMVRYVILSFGGFLGLGEKLFALPWQTLNYDATQDCFILNIDKEKLKKAPGIDKNSPPDWADEQWGISIYQFYGARPYWHDEEHL